VFFSYDKSTNNIFSLQLTAAWKWEMLDAVMMHSGRTVVLVTNLGFCTDDCSTKVKLLELC
jgi:hypothetical protein